MSINGCLEIDLAGQVNSESVGTEAISAVGGQLDFILGTARSQNGRSVLCMASTAQLKDGSCISKIQAVLPPGSVVTTPRHCVDYISTEYGIVNLRGKSIWDRAELLISIAHPDFQDQLVKDAEKYQIWTRRNKEA
jgi:acyl-CoA hydrolase